MIEQLLFTVAGTPRPKTRPRFVKGRVVTTANPHEKLWRKWVERAAFSAVMHRGDPVPVFRGPVRVRMVFTFEPPRRERERIGTPHTHKPDTDNLAKLVMDAMQRAGVFHDDALVAQCPVEKWWGERAGVVVLTELIDAAPVAPSVAEPDAPGWLTANR